MKVLLQWTLSDPQDYEEVEFTNAMWRGLPRRPIPSNPQAADNVPGYLFSFVIQGVIFSGFDHYACEEIDGGGIRSFAWNDDLEDEGTDFRWGQVREFRPGWIDNTYEVPGGKIRHEGPDQKLTVYSEDIPAMALAFPQYDSYGPVALLDWSLFPTPSPAITLHGVWVHDEALYKRHLDVVRPVDWREWM